MVCFWGGRVSGGGSGSGSWESILREVFCEGKKAVKQVMREKMKMGVFFLNKKNLSGG